MSCGQVKTDLCWQEKTAAFPWCQLHGNYCPILGSLSSDDGIDNENGNNAIGLDWQNNNSAHASRFIVHFFAFTARLRRKMPNFTSFSFFGGRGRGREHKTTTYFFFSWTSIALQNSAPERIANIWRIVRDGINAIKFEAARIHFLSDVFAAVAFGVA